MKKKGFTLVELLVVIAIIAMLLAILMPALNKVRQIAYRVVCSSNLSGLGKACITYANDYQESYPAFGAATCVWGTTFVGTNGISAWNDDVTANTTHSPANNTTATVTASMFLLIKYADVSTGSFVCKASDTKKFDLTAAVPANTVTAIKDVTQCWDFGPVTAGGNTTPWKFVSYAYQSPYLGATASTVAAQPITASSQAGRAVFADKNPYIRDIDGTFETTVADTGTNITTGPVLPTNASLKCDPTVGTPNKDILRYANSKNHNYDGQNVLFADAHTSFETAPNVGIEQDNIYTAWGVNAATGNPSLRQGGVAPARTSAAGQSQSDSDSFLVQ